MSITSHDAWVWDYKQHNLAKYVLRVVLEQRSMTRYLKCELLYWSHYKSVCVLTVICLELDKTGLQGNYIILHAQILTATRQIQQFIFKSRVDL